MHTFAYFKIEYVYSLKRQRNPQNDYVIGIIVFFRTTYERLDRCKLLADQASTNQTSPDHRDERDKKVLEGWFFEMN